MKRKLKGIEFFDVMVYIIITLVCFAMLYPFLNVIAVSFSEYSEFLKNPMMIIPRKINFNAFLTVFKDPLIIPSYITTILVTLIGTLTGIVLLILTGYPLSKKDLKGKAFFMNVVVFTMMFHGGLIPTYNLLRGLNMIDTIWVLAIPGCLTAFNLVLIKNFYESLPESLVEAAKIDGAGEWYILGKIIIPLSKPIIATLVMFLAVQYWNNYYNAMIYVRKRTLWTLQLVLRELVLSGSAQGQDENDTEKKVVSITIKYASLIVVMLPILLVYPFAQKYFVKGVMVGAVKG